MKAADIPDAAMLSAVIIAQRYDSGSRWGFAIGNFAMDGERVPEKLVLAKLRKLIKRGLVDGCACGCRGDFRITQDGLRVWVQAGHG